jgi:hypothetical protein
VGGVELLEEGLKPLVCSEFLRKGMQYRSVHDECRNRQVPGAEWYVPMPDWSLPIPGWPRRIEAGSLRAAPGPSPDCAGSCGSHP